MTQRQRTGIGLAALAAALVALNVVGVLDAIQHVAPAGCLGPLPPGVTCPPTA